LAIAWEGLTRVTTCSARKALTNLGGKWRGLERYCATRPGTFTFVRAIYNDDSSTPAALEYRVIRVDGSLDMRQFDR
jgi:hypothetical protein